MKVCDQTGHKSLEMLRVYTRDAELFAGKRRGRPAAKAWATAGIEPGVVGNLSRRHMPGSGLKPPNRAEAYLAVPSPREI
jgi:hypothetical protein